MAIFLYLHALRAILDHIEGTQSEAIEQAADLAIHALTDGGAVFCHEIGHANQHDFLNRAGGLAAVQAFTFSFAVSDPLPECLKDRPGGREVERDLETVRLAVRSSSLREGDVMLLGSVSGKNRGPVELALACREIGVKVVAFTSLVYTAQVESLHPSGKKLCEVADVVIDNGAPYGDAACQIPGLDVSALPVSGASAIIAGWCVWERVMTKMAAAGNPPTVFLSVNRKGGPEHYLQMREQFEKRGY